MVRNQEGITVSVDTSTGDVAVLSDLEQEVKVDGERVGIGYDDAKSLSKKVEERLTKEILEDLENRVCDREANLQTEATDKLEAELDSLRAELNQAVNRVTAEALKKKAVQLGKIKRVTEDTESGSLTIVLEI